MFFYFLALYIYNSLGVHPSCILKVKNQTHMLVALKVFFVSDSVNKNKLLNNIYVYIYIVVGIGLGTHAKVE